MLNEITFKNFKCFDNCSIPLRTLNVFAGENGCGKSTVIQSILLLKQSYERNHNLENIIISGEYVNLGNSSDILNEYTEDSIININIVYNKAENINVDIPYEANRNLLALTYASTTDINTINIFNESFEYIAADRISPQNIYSSINYSRNLGIHGEKVFSYLSLYRREPIFDSLCIRNVPNELIYQTNEWLKKLFHGFNFSIQEHCILKK